MDSQYLAEKVFLENYVKTIIGDPDLATIMNEELFLLGQKVIFETKWQYFRIYIQLVYILFYHLTIVGI